MRKYSTKPRSTWGDVDYDGELYPYLDKNTLDSGARAILDNPDPVSVDTGLVDRYGNQIIRTECKNGIGFHANIDLD